MRRFDVDTEHAARVRATALGLYQQLQDTWDLCSEDLPEMLCWAADLHEIGLVVSHSHYQKHGAYLLRNSDLSGFTRQEQDALAALVLGHRRKFPLDTFMALPRTSRDRVRKAVVLLRLAVLIHRGRSATADPNPEVAAQGESLSLRFGEGWLDDHPLTRLEFEQEAVRLGAAGITLDVR
jgi:exopolyphosphatase/guanosine-5'-triphosphate,3'-diphosphate pyrophosphatase